MLLFPDPESSSAQTASVAATLVHLADVSPDAILLYDEQWRILYANKTARAGISYPEEELIGATLWDLYPALLGTELERVYREAVAKKQPRRLDAFYFAQIQRWSEIHIFPLEHGAAVLYRDITAIKETEFARDAAGEKLQQVLEATTDAILSMDWDSRISYMNRHAMELLETDESVLGKNIRECFPGVLYEGSPLIESYHRALKDGQSEFEAFYPEPLNKWLQISARPSKDRIIAFFRDVTQQKRAAAAMMQTEKLAAVGRLASSIAHEINNPLESVTNLIYLARERALHPETQQYLDMAEQELRRIALIANQTLQFHKQATRPQAIGCDALFGTVLNIYAGKLRNSNITVEKRQRARHPVVCFEGEIRQVLNNLVGNAIDAMPGGGRLLVRGRDATDWKTSRAGLMLTVADTGVGINRETQAKMFDAFFTTKGAGGTGLGLWVSCEIVKRHHGRLRIRSSQRQPHRGTVVALFLPYQGTPQSNAANL